MKQSEIEKLNNIIKSHNQFKRSLLWTDISIVLKCDIDEAEKLAHTHCNMVSFWAILKASGKLDNHYRDFFEWCLETDVCNKKGFISVYKDDIVSSLGIKDVSFVKFRDFEDIKDPNMRLNHSKFYQMKIKGNTEGFHFMAGYVEDGIFKLSDTSYRGIGVKASDHITEKNFCWIMES